MIATHAVRHFLAAALVAALAPPSLLHAQPSTTTAQPRPWLYQNSDIPMDPAWRFGILPNGVRYAIRRNDVPAKQVSIRVRVDVGSLMEEVDEAGYAHVIEHLSFRGSRAVPDGESKRIWQRLGADFGTDSNAQTTATGTTYAVDLPDASQAGLEESLKILAGMISAPNIVPEAVDAERSVVMAERREGLSPSTQVSDETRRFFYAGQPLADHAAIGTEESLQAATPQRLQAFHDRWYRPERTVVSISGDADPAMLEALLTKHFGTWSVDGAAPPPPDFGKPDPKAPSVKVIVAPDVAASINLIYLRPWRAKADTIAFNQARIVDDVALQLINRRLEAAANSGAPFLSAAVTQSDLARSVNATFVSIVPLGEDWESALTAVRAIIEDARQTEPSKADIDREYISLEGLFTRNVATSEIESSARQASDVTNAVDIRETIASPQIQLDIYRASRQFMTPEQLRDSTRRLFSGDAERALLILKKAQPQAQARLRTAFYAKVEPARDARLDATPVTIAALPDLGPPGTVGASQSVGALGIEQIRFDNGVTLYLRSNRAEPGKVRINVRFGHGRQSFAPDENAALWAAPYALMASGIGDLDKSALDELTNGRQLGLLFGIGEDAFALSAVSSPQDYKDQLRLYAAKLAFPRWDEGPLARTVAALNASYDPVPSSAGEALGRDLTWLLSDKDERLAPAKPEDATRLTLERFKATWAPRLATGPLEVQLFGDVDRDEAVAAVAATFGALAPRPDTVPPVENRVLRFPKAQDEPLLLTHNGAAEQAAVAVAWPTGGGTANIRESRQLDMLARIISDRLFEKLRSIDGAAYTPSAESVWPEDSASGGYLVVQTQLRPERMAYFLRLMDEIAVDLATHPVSDDELARQIEPVRKLIERARASNAYWMSQLAGLSRDPRKLLMAYNLAPDLLNVTPADLQALAQRYLKAETRWSTVVLAKDVPLPDLGESRQVAQQVAQGRVQARSAAPAN